MDHHLVFDLGWPLKIMFSLTGLKNDEPNPHRLVRDRDIVNM